MLEGGVGSLAHDTLYIYGADALYERIDTVVAVNGMFSYKAKVDTVTPMWVLFPNMHREMVFADKGLTATMQGDTAAAGHISIVGGKQNALLSSFRQLTDTITDEKRITEIADSFIRSNPFAEASIHLLREYFIQQPQPNHTKIKALIAAMSGNLQDNNYIKQLQHEMSTYKPLSKSSTVGSYNVRDKEGKNITTSDYKETYLLITFWASWDEESRQRQRELVDIKEKYKKHNFDILSISLDTDRKAWLQAIAEDGATWRQACDLEGWRTGIVERMQVKKLPANFLLSTTRRVQAIDLYGEELDKKIGELTTVRKSEKKDKKTPHNIRKIKQ